MIPAALLLALLAASLSGRHLRLAAFAIGIGGACFVIGMAAAVITDHPLF
jgi:nitrate/nitrite transporter NarK